MVGVIRGDFVWPDAEVHRRELTIRASRNATRVPEDMPRWGREPRRPETL